MKGQFLVGIIGIILVGSVFFLVISACLSVRKVDKEISLHDYAQLEYRKAGEHREKKIRECLEDGKITDSEYWEIVKAGAKDHQIELESYGPKERLIQKYKGN